jgi:hypothetical protein
VTVPAVTATLLNNSSGVLDIGGGQIYKDSSGNVGIGTAAPTSRLSVLQPALDGNAFVLPMASSAANGNFTSIRGKYAVANEFCRSEIRFGVQSESLGTGFLAFATGDNTATERARIDSSGNLLVGTTSDNPIAARTNGIANLGAGFVSMRGANNMALGLSGSSGANIAFYTDNGSTYVTAGNISSSGASTSFNTSSDYRMKENVQPMVGALNKVLALKPVTYTWKPEFVGSNANGQGFIAHELQAVVPDCVTGEKDAVQIVDDLDEEGNKIGTKEVPQYQGVDTSFLVATLVAAIQELKADFDAYKAAHP